MTTIVDEEPIFKEEEKIEKTVGEDLEVVDDEVLSEKGKGERLFDVKGEDVLERYLKDFEETSEEGAPDVEDKDDLFYSDSEKVEEPTSHGISKRGKASDDLRESCLQGGRVCEAITNNQFEEEDPAMAAGADLFDESYEIDEINAGGDADLADEAGAEKVEEWLKDVERFELGEKYRKVSEDVQQVKEEVKGQVKEKVKGRRKRRKKIPKRLKKSSERKREEELERKTRNEEAVRAWTKKKDEERAKKKILEKKKAETDEKRDVFRRLMVNYLILWYIYYVI